MLNKATGIVNQCKRMQFYLSVGNMVINSVSDWFQSASVRYDRTHPPLCGRKNVFNALNYGHLLLGHLIGGPLKQCNVCDLHVCRLSDRMCIVTTINCYTDKCSVELH